MYWRKLRLPSSIMDDDAHLNLGTLEGGILISYFVIVSPMLVVFD